MATTFDTWLAELRAAGKLADTLYIDRGLPFEWIFAVEGDWTGASIESSLRVQPDTGSVVETFTATNEGYNAGIDGTEFKLALIAADTAALPAADPVGEGVARLAWDVLFTPSGGSKMRLMGADAAVLGEVTDA